MAFLHTIINHKYFKTLIFFLFFSLSFFIWFLFHVYHLHHAVTEDAYVNANVVQIAPRLTGKIAKLAINNNQYVKKGDLLFIVDALPFQLAVNSAYAELMLSKAEMENAILTEKRVNALVKKKFLPPQEGDNATAHVKIAYAKVLQANAHLSSANLNLTYVNVAAPVDGWVTNLTIREGDMVEANQPLFALITDGEFWVDANFKETELTDVRPGQSAIITTDIYPTQRLKGIVESISGGTGTAFSLLPPQNASANWIKVTQRIPVRIRILNKNNRFPLRIGMSAKVIVNLDQPADTNK